MLDHTGNVSKEIEREEHRSKGNVNGKATVLYGYLPGTDQYVPLKAIDNGDGTYTLDSKASFGGTINSSPTFKDDPTNAGETPKYGKTNPTTHKVQVESILTDTTGANTASIDANGALAIQSGGTPGAAVPARAVQIGGTDGANLRAFATDASGVQKIRDDYQTGQILADQTGANAVLTFTFTTAVDFIWVTDTSATTTNISRVDPFGGTPSATLGIPVFNATPTPINVTPAATVVKVYAPTGATISVYGYRRA